MLSNAPSNNTATECTSSLASINDTRTTTPGLSAHDGQQQHHVNITTGARYLTCGNSTQDARSHGCRYDVLLNNWVPAPCYDADFIAEYEEDGSSAAYRDAALTQRIDPGGEALGELEFYYTSRRDHVSHCAMMWRKQFAVLFERRAAFDSVIADPFHTEHCSQYLLDAPGNAVKGGEVEPTKTFVGFAGCWVRDEDKAK
ncbi:glycoside hydrolase family 10 protein [Apiospora arundinis]